MDGTRFIAPSLSLTLWPTLSKTRVSDRSASRSFILRRPSSNRIIPIPSERYGLFVEFILLADEPFQGHHTHWSLQRLFHDTDAERDLQNIPLQRSHHA